jgi:lactoylglutathione lyase
VLGIQQVSVAGPPNAAYQMRHFWGDLMELGPPVHTYQSAHENVHSEVVPLGPKTKAQTRLSMITALDETKKPKIQARALHHVGLWVDDLPQCVEWLQGKGVNFILDSKSKKPIRSPGPMGWDVAFINPKTSPEFPISGCGVLIQLVQAPADMLKE